MRVGKVFVDGGKISFTIEDIPKDIKDGTYSLVLYSYEIMLRLKEAETALRFYAEGGSDLEPRAEKAHLYDKEYPVGSTQWLSRSMSDYQTGRRARDYFKRWGR